MICQKCGSSINDDSVKYCANCGTKISRSISEKNTMISLDDHVKTVMGQVFETSLKGTSGQRQVAWLRYLWYTLIVLIIICTYFIYEK